MALQRDSNRRGLNKFSSTSMRIIEVVHDDKGAVDTILAWLGMASQKDLWHKQRNWCTSLSKSCTKKKFNMHNQWSSVLANLTWHGWQMPLCKIEDCLFWVSKANWWLGEFKSLGFEPRSGCENLTSTCLKSP